MIFLHYPLTRPIILTRWTTVATIVFAIVFITFITLLNVIAVGYELVFITSTEYNVPYKLWYEKILPSSDWIPSSRTCQSAIINVGDCYSP